MMAGVPLAGQVSLGATSCILWNVDSVELPPRSPCEIVGIRQLSAADERRWSSRVAFEVRRFQTSSSNQIAASGDFRIAASKPGPGYCGVILPITQAGVVGTQFRPVAGSFSIAAGTGPLLKMDGATPSIFASNVVQPTQGFILTGSGGGASAPANLIDPVDSTIIQLGILIYDPFGVTTDKTSGFKAACVFCKDRWVAIGGASTGTGGGGGQEPFCGMIRFELLQVFTDRVVEELDPEPAEVIGAMVRILSRPCGCTEVPKERDDGLVTVYDPMGCHLVEDTAEGTQGTAKYMDGGLSLPDGEFDEGFNFRNSEAFVTDGENETFANESTPTFPPHGWEDATDVQSADSNAGVDNRLAGYVVPAPSIESGSHNTIRFKITLPEAGKYLISLAIGNAEEYSQEYSAIVKLYDDESEFKYLTPNLTELQHADATGTVHTTAEWPDNHTKFPHEFESNIFIVELTGATSYLSHIRVESASNCQWEIDGMCCDEETPA